MRVSLDRGIFLAVIFLLGLGLVQVYSAGYIFAIETYDDGLFFVRRQLFFVILSIVIMIAAAYTPWKWIEKWGFLVFALSVLGVAATYLPGIGVKVGGAHRWVNLPLGLRFEPSEILKISFPLLIASFISRDGKSKSSVQWPLQLFAVMIPLLLLLKQPDFGSFVICVLVIFSLFFAFGLRWHYVIALGSFAVGAFYYLIINAPYRLARLRAFLDPWADPEAKGFQVIQSLLSFYSGGVTGTGLGQGQGKLFFLPEAHTDFTLAVLGEEIGFLGIVLVLVLFGFLIFRGLQIAARAKTNFAQATALGIVITFALSCFINSGVAMGLLPTKGLALPFLSYGGSALVSTCLGFGILLNIERQSRSVKVQNKIKPFSGLSIK